MINFEPFGMSSRRWGFNGMRTEKGEGMRNVKDSLCVLANEQTVFKSANWLGRNNF